MGDSSGDLDRGRGKATVRWSAGLDGRLAAPAAHDPGLAVLGHSRPLHMIGSKGLLLEDFLREIKNN